MADRESQSRMRQELVSLKHFTFWNMRYHKLTFDVEQGLALESDAFARLGPSYSRGSTSMIQTALLANIHVQSLLTELWLRRLQLHSGKRQLVTWPAKVMWRLARHAKNCVIAEQVCSIR